MNTSYVSVNNTIDAAFLIRQAAGKILAFDGPSTVALQDPRHLGQTAARDFLHDVVAHQGSVSKEIQHLRPVELNRTMDPV